MPLLLILVGLVLVVSAIRGSTGTIATQLVNDISGGFIKWIAAVIAIGALGYIPGMRDPSRYLMALVALAIFLTSGRGFFEEFVRQVENPPQPSAIQPAGGNPNLPSIPVSSSSGSSSSGGGGGMGSATSMLGGFGGSGGAGGLSVSDVATIATLAA